MVTLGLCICKAVTQAACQVSHVTPFLPQFGNEPFAHMIVSISRHTERGVEYKVELRQVSEDLGKIHWQVK